MKVVNPTPVCFFAAAALASEANAFTVLPPATVEIPATIVGNQEFVASSLASSSVQTSPSNLPSQRELLESLGSLTVAATEAPKAAAPAKSAATSTATTTTTTTATPAATKGIRIATINFDGKVPKTESDEYVVIQNSSKDTIDVSGYIIYPATTGNKGSTFSFPKGSTIQPNSSVRIYTNEIHKETGGYSWSSGRALWANGGGLAVLEDSKGKKVGEYKYVPADAATKKS